MIGWHLFSVLPITMGISIVGLLIWQWLRSSNPWRQLLYGVASLACLGAIVATASYVGQGRYPEALGAAIGVVLTFMAADELG